MIFENQNFEGKVIQLDGNSFYKCRFKRCVLLYHGYLNVFLSEPVMEECQFELQGPARQVIEFLANSYGGGLKDAIERLFQAIRRGPAGREEQKPN